MNGILTAPATGDDVPSRSDTVDLPSLAVFHQRLERVGEEAWSTQVQVMREQFAESARQFATRSNRVISAGRPPCPLCDEPLDPEGHICVRTNGYRRGALAGSDDDDT